MFKLWLNVKKFKKSKRNENELLKTRVAKEMSIPRKTKKINSKSKELAKL